MEEKQQQPSSVVVEQQEHDKPVPPVYEVTLNPRPIVTFDETAIDNEFMGKKKSKSRCLAHAYQVLPADKDYRMLYFS